MLEWTVAFIDTKDLFVADNFVEKDAYERWHGNSAQEGGYLCNKSADLATLHARVSASSLNSYHLLPTTRETPKQVQDLEREKFGQYFSKYTSAHCMRTQKHPFTLETSSCPVIKSSSCTVVFPFCE